MKSAFLCTKLSIDLQHFRHFASGVVHLIAGILPSYQKELTDLMEIDHLQAGHSTVVAESNYSRRETDLPLVGYTQLSRYRNASLIVATLALLTKWVKSFPLLTLVAVIEYWGSAWKIFQNVFLQFFVLR